jgi:predicted ester cyclase
MKDKEPQQDPVVDKSLQNKFELYETWDRVRGTKWSLQGDWNESKEAFIKRIFKEYKSIAIEDFIKELRKEFADLPVHKWTAGDLMQKAEKLKDKICKQ